MVPTGPPSLTAAVRYAVLIVDPNAVANIAHERLQPLLDGQTAGASLLGFLQNGNRPLLPQPPATNMPRDSRQAPKRRVRSSDRFCGVATRRKLLELRSSLTSAAPLTNPCQ